VIEYAATSGFCVVATEPGAKLLELKIVTADVDGRPPRLTKICCPDVALGAV
jgi:hypothetical protein